MPDVYPTASSRHCRSLDLLSLNLTRVASVKALGFNHLSFGKAIEFFLKARDTPSCVCGRLLFSILRTSGVIFRQFWCALLRRRVISTGVFRRCPVLYAIKSLLMLQSEMVSQLGCLFVHALLVFFFFFLFSYCPPSMVF